MIIIIVTVIIMIDANVQVSNCDQRGGAISPPGSESPRTKPCPVRGLGAQVLLIMVFDDDNEKEEDN